MKQLLKVYVKDFALSSLYLYILVWVLGLTIFYIGQDSEDLSTILLTLFTCFFSILFLFSYPLTKCLQWVLYTPIPKSHLVIFNILFQIYKLLVVSVLCMILVAVIHLISPQDILFDMGKWETFLTKYHFSFESPFWESSVVFGLGLFMTFMLALVFSVSPQLVVENRHGPAQGPKSKDYGYLFQKYKKKLIWIIPLGLFLKWSHGFWTSPLFIVSFGMSYIIFATFWSYSEKLIFSQVIHQRIVFGGVALFLINLFTTFSYSSYRLHSGKVDISGQINEIVFQKKFHRGLSEEKLLTFLESPLDEKDLRALMDLFYPNSSLNFLRKKSIHADMKPVPGFPLINHPLETLHFQKVTSTKRDLGGLQASLGLFDLKKLSFGELDEFLTRWHELRGKQKRIGTPLFLSERLKDYPFLKDHLISLLRSKNETKQFVAITLSTQFPQYHLHKEIMSNVLSYNTDILFLASKTLSKIQCRSISSVDMVLLHKEWEQLPETDPTHCPAAGH